MSGPGRPKDVFRSAQREGSPGSGPDAVRHVAMEARASHASTGEPRSTRPDWSREGKYFWSWHPSRSLLASLRDYERLRDATRFDRILLRRLAVLRHHFWSVVTGADIPLGCAIDGGLLLPHPNGIVVHPDARIGPNCLLFQQVTLGVGGAVPGVPTLAANVDVGAGAKVLGGITIGAGAVIGANAVVLQDVPPGATAVGIPARILHPGVARSRP